MEDYTWNTNEAMATNTDTMNDFIDNHMAEYCGVDYEVVHEDGAYVEIQNDKHILYGVHASGNGDFCSHRVKFEELK